MTTFLNVKNNAASKLAAAISDSAGSLTVLAGEGARFPSSNFHVTIDDEILLCSSRTNDVLTITRAQESTGAAAHAKDAAVRLNITAAIIDELVAAITALQAGNTAMARAYLNTETLNIPSDEYCRIELDSKAYDPGSNFNFDTDLKTGTTDAGTTDKKIIDAAVSFGASDAEFKAMGLFGAMVSSPTGGAHVGYIQGWTNEHEVQIEQAGTAVAFAPGQEYHINHAEYVVPVAGYYTIVGNISWKYNTIIADKAYRVMVYKNGGALFDAITTAAATRNHTSVALGHAHLAAGDVLCLVCMNYTSADTVDVTHGPLYTWMSVVLNQAD